MLNGRARRGSKLAGFGALTFIAFVTIAAFISLALQSGGQLSIAGIWHDSYLLSVIRFTIWQAVLSALLSVLPAIFIARALSRQTSFFGRAFLLKLFALPLALPALVAVLAILGLWGRSGWINTLIGEHASFNIFGLTGILIAHIFFNLPLATRLFLARLETIPNETWRLAAQLAMPTTSVFRFIEFPVIKTALPGIFALVFMLCLTSFTIVLTLGGGPSSTTLEVAIYQSLRFDFDPPRAVTLALIQLAITALFLIVSFKFTKTLETGATLKKQPDRFGRPNRISSGLDFLLIGMAGFFVAAPLLTLLIDGLTSDLFRLLTTPAVWNAVLTSLILAITAAGLCLCLAWAMINPIAREQTGYAKTVAFASSAILVMPTTIIGTGWFIIFHKIGSVFSFAPLLVVVINALMALPFVYRILAPAMAQANQQHSKLVTMLALSGWLKFRLIDFPVLKKPLGLAFAFTMALSLGDLGVIALFGSQDLTTLPLLLFKSLGSYRTNDAQGLAFILTLACMVILFVADKFSSTGKTANAQN